MSTVDNSHNAGFWHRVATTRVYMLLRSRKQFHYAVEVLFHSAVQGCTIGVAVILLKLFGMSFTFDVALLAHLIGPLGVGALAAGHARLLFSSESALSGWIVSGVFGAVTVLVFMVLVSLRHGTLELPALALSLIAGAAIFMLLHWLFLLEARKSRAA